MKVMCGFIVYMQTLHKIDAVWCLLVSTCRECGAKFVISFGSSFEYFSNICYVLLIFSTTQTLNENERNMSYVILYVLLMYSLLYS